MSTEVTIPATLPVEFVERMIHVSGEYEMFRPQIGGVVSLDGRLDEARMRRALRLLLDAEPVLGCRFVAEAVPPVWQRLDGLDALRLLDVRESADPEGDAAAFIARPLDRRADPQLLAMLVRGSSGDLLAVKVGHVAMDGGALKEALYLAGEFYRTLGDRPDWTPQPNVDGVRRPTARAGLLEHLRSLDQSAVLPPPSEWKTPSLGSAGAREYVTATVEPEAFRAAVALGKAAGATVNDVLLTALYRTLYRLLRPAPGAKTPLTLSCELRKHLPAGTRTALSNISGAWHISVSPAEDEPFDGTLIRVVAATSAWKRAGAGRKVAVATPMTYALTRRLGLGFVRKMMSQATGGAAEKKVGGLGLTNIGIIDESRLDFGASAHVTDAWLLGPISAVSVILTASTYRDRLHLALGTEFASMDGEPVSAVVEGTVGEIESWVTSRATQR